MQTYDVKDILLEVLIYKTYRRDWWKTSTEWLVIIPRLGSSRKLDWNLKFDGEQVYDGMQIQFINNTFHIWFDFHDYDGPKNSKKHIHAYLNECEKYIFKPIDTPSRKEATTAWFKPYRKNFQSLNKKKLMGNSVDGETEEVQPQ